MENNILNEFVKDMGEGIDYADVKVETLKKYEDKFMTEKDNEDIITMIWKKYGLRSYKSGLFWFVNPDEYNDIAIKFPNVSEGAIVFARTGLGNLFLYEKTDMGKFISFLNVHSGISNLISTSFEVLLEWRIVTNSYWETHCYGKIELEANKKYGQMEEDECYTFVPALALGGDEKIANLQKVKIKENLEFLSQLHSK